MIKEFSSKTSTLAIGDGANDVNMISSANVGVGIIGKEGNQASRASDYSIGEFRMLKYLLFVHGRESYRKNAYIIVYNFYKNLVFLIPQFMLGYYSFFSGLPLYDPYIYQLYNLIFTSVPIIIYGILDKDAFFEKLDKDVKYYHMGMRSLNFSKKKIILTSISGLVQGIIIFFGVFVIFSNSQLINYSYSDVYSAGSIVFFLSVLIVNFRILFISGEISIISASGVILSILAYPLVLLWMNVYISYDNFGTFQSCFSFHSIMFMFIFTKFCLLLDNFIGKFYWLISYNVIKDA